MIGVLGLAECRCCDLLSRFSVCKASCPGVRMEAPERKWEGRAEGKDNM